MKRILIVLVCVCFSTFVLAQHPDQIDVSSYPDGIFTDTINGMIVKGTVLNSKKEGTWTVSFNTEVISLLIQYVNGLKSGLVIEMDRNALMLAQSNFLNDSLNGTRLVFTGGGHPQLNEHYKHGKLDGSRQVFYEKGKLQEQSEYVNGLKTGKSTWYDDEGKMLAEYNYLNGLFDGGQQVFYPNGNIKSEQWYKMNVLDGKNVQFYENGKKKLEGNYLMGEKVGPWKMYDDAGKETKVLNYREVK